MIILCPCLLFVKLIFEDTDLLVLHHWMTPRVSELERRVMWRTIGEFDKNWPERVFHYLLFDRLVCVIRHFLICCLLYCELCCSQTARLALIPAGHL